MISLGKKREKMKNKKSLASKKTRQKGTKKTLCQTDKREKKNDNDDDETPHPSEKKRELKLHKYTEIKKQEERKRSVYTEKITACQPSHPKLSNPSNPNPIRSDPIPIPIQSSHHTKATTQSGSGSTRNSRSPTKSYNART
jgi:hypothetical protein